MNRLVCHIQDPTLDPIIGEALGFKGRFVSEKAASLRGMYDTYLLDLEDKGIDIEDKKLNYDDLSQENINKIKNTLNDYRNYLRESHVNQMKNITKYVDRCWDNLRYAFSLEQREEAAECIANAFSEEVDRFLSLHPNLSREQYIHGFVDSKGTKTGGEVSILEGVYNNLLNKRLDLYVNFFNKDLKYQEWKKNESSKYQAEDFKDAQEFGRINEERYNNYTKLLEYWNELLPFVMRKLMDREGVKLGLNRSYASVAASDSFGENDIATNWDISESKRDGWMDNSDLMSSFGSVSKEVRRILATIPQLVTVPVYGTIINEEGKEVPVQTGVKSVIARDSFGNIKYMDPVKAHQALQEMLYKAVSSKDMMSVLTNPGTGKAKAVWMQPIVDILNAHPNYRTQFYVDFKKVYQPYSMMIEDEKYRRKNGVKRFITKILNKSKNLIIEGFETSLSVLGTHPEGPKKSNPKYIFQEKGSKINWENLAELRNIVTQWTDEKPINGNSPFSIDESMLTKSQRNGNTKSSSDKALFLFNTFAAMGFDIDMDTVFRIVNSTDIYNVRKELINIFDLDNQQSGIMNALNAIAGNKVRKAFDNLCNAKDRGDSKNIKKYLETLSQLTNFTFQDLYNAGSATAGSVFKEHTRKLLDIINNKGQGLSVESRARYMGNTMYSHVAPSYLGDKLNLIKRYVEEENKTGLLQFLKEEYLQSPLFVDNDFIISNGTKGRIYNKWLEELVKACLDEYTPLRNSVAAIFTYERDLGSSTKKFEDFTAKEYAIDMLIHYWADEDQNKSFGGKRNNDLNKRVSALYPIFTLGDAGVSKYIRAPRIISTVPVDDEGNVVDSKSSYSNYHLEYRFDKKAQNKVIDAFYDIYIQERRRMEMDKSIAHIMYANGKPIPNMTSSFSILTFLNPDSQTYSEEYKLTDQDRNNPYKVKEVIRKYLTASAFEGYDVGEGNNKTHIPGFKERLENLGVLETIERDVRDKKGNLVIDPETKRKKTKKIYKNVSSLFNSQDVEGDIDKINNKIMEFYWNTKLATIQQLQMMTIDPSFYNGSKDLQKRYKEIHAPGNILDIYALDYDGKRYSDGIERAVYFEDISINAETSNPEFMETILRNYASDKEAMEQAIKEGIVTPLKGNAEKARQDKLKSLLGNNYDLYNSYTENTLTDGQGYRTLTSYRKVMGMAGKWSEYMENAYKEIISLREQYKDMDIPASELSRIADLALVLQPIKPYMFTHERYKIQVAQKDKEGNVVKDGNGNPIMVDAYKYIPVQHKYAEALIIPELLPRGNKLRDMAIWMDENNVDLVGSTKIVKVGCWGQANLKYKIDNYGYCLDKEGNYLSKTGKSLGKDLEKITDKDAILTMRDKDFESLATPLSQDKKGLVESLSRATIHQLSYSDYRIQTNVPEHINASQLFGTQIRKLIMSGIEMNTLLSDYLPAEFVNLDTGDGQNRSAKLIGKNVLALYNSLICANIFESLKTFETNASDVEKLSDLLKQTTIGVSRETMDNLFAYAVTGIKGKNFFLPLFEGSMEHDTASLIASTFRKIVNKQQINGGSAVQVSAFGIKGYEESGDLRYVQDPNNNANILYAECELPFDRSYTVKGKDDKGNSINKKVNLAFEDYCYTEGQYYGELLPSNEEVKKDSKDYKKYLSYTYREVDGKLVPCSYKDPQAKVYKPKIEQVYPNILNIIAYRIPTERDYSMINLRIKRFSSKTAGGTLKVPAQGTTIAGFDFDIDKLYFMQREYVQHFNNSIYKENNFTQSQIQDIWDAFYDKNTDIREALELERGKAELRDPSLIEVITIKKGPFSKKQYRHKTTLNSYWKQAGITKDKQTAFSETAQALKITPENISEEEKNSLKEFEQYDFTKTPEENKRTARNNLLLDIISARLSDPSTIKQRYTPGGFKNASKAARFMRELFYGDLKGVLNGNHVDFNTLENRDKSKDPEPNYDVSDPYTMLYYNEQNQIAGKLIGIFANQNTNHAFCSAMEQFELLNPIEFCGKSLKDLLHKNDGLADQVDLYMAEFLASSVDAVKDPTLNFLNLNTITADAGALLARIGYNTREIGLLFNQPIIRKVCQEALNSTSSSTTALSYAIEDAKAQLMENGRADKTSLPSLSANNLALSIIKNRQTIEKGGNPESFMDNDAPMQLAVLEIFDSIVKVAADISTFVLNTKFTASNAVKSTLGGFEAQQMKVVEWIRGFKMEGDNIKTNYCQMRVASGLSKQGLASLPINRLLDISDKEYLHYVRFNPFAYEQLMFDSNKRFLKIMSKYYPYDKPLYSNIHRRMQGLSSYGTLTEDEINDMNIEIPVAALAVQTHSLFNGEAAYTRNEHVYNVTNREYYRKYFARDLIRFLSDNPQYKDYSIFKYVTVKTAQESYKDDEGMDALRDIYSLAIQDVGGLDSTTKDEFKESWSSLMEVDKNGFYKDEDAAEIGKGLFMYCFYQMGFTYSPISFMHLAPVRVKDSIVVPRNEIQPINSFDPFSDEYQGNDIHAFTPAADDKDHAILPDNELYKNIYILPEKMDPNSVRRLVTTAMSHPELTFKIDKELTDEEIKNFAYAESTFSVPKNIYFTKGTTDKLNSKGMAEEMRYGIYRSYREFLYEILDGQTQGLSTESFVRQHILNHVDNSKWVLDVNKGPFLREFFNNRVLRRRSIESISENEENPMFHVDVSTILNSQNAASINKLVRLNFNQDGQIIRAEWVPVIKIKGYYYMANSKHGELFNINNNTAMNYVKVVPLGSYTKLTYDNNKELPISMKYMADINSEDIVGTEDIKDTPLPTDLPSAPTDNSGTEQTEEDNSDKSSHKGNSTDAIENFKHGNNDMAMTIYRNNLQDTIIYYLKQDFEAKGIPFNEKAQRFSLQNKTTEELEQMVEDIMNNSTSNPTQVKDENNNDKPLC